ncbi:hypothetical protein QQF64_019338 [Cirrhinus molitorella]|uniref:Immunoglobulin V-set domain-containing protein n=1 Tax=Cirrhinus molitorella TaxID=172907 RepID=A0ABR3LF65_9TELE
MGVFGRQTGGTEKVSVMEGDSVTLHTGQTEILKDNHILWILWLNSSNICIAEMFMQAITFPDGNEIFRDRLKMDNKTGSLTITNITTAHHGLYELTIVRASKVSSKTFLVNVYVFLPREIECLESYSCVLNKSITNHTKPLNSTELCQPCPGRVHCCGFTEAVIRLAISAVVAVATVIIVVYDIRERRTETKLKEKYEDTDSI